MAPLLMRAIWTPISSAMASVTKLPKPHSAIRQNGRDPLITVEALPTSTSIFSVTSLPYKSTSFARCKSWGLLWSSTMGLPENSTRRPRPSNLSLIFPRNMPYLRRDKYWHNLIASHALCFKKIWRVLGVSLANYQRTVLTLTSGQRARPGPCSAGARRWGTARAELHPR